MMLNHIGQNEIATKVHNAWLKTLEDGIHTYDIFKEGISKEKVGTKEFADAVIARMGQKPSTLKAVEYKKLEKKAVKKEVAKKAIKQRKDLAGIDVYLDFFSGSAEDLGELLKKVNSENLTLAFISNRGVKVWPDCHPDIFCTDHWRCRYLATNKGEKITHSNIISLLEKIDDAGFDFIKTEHLYNFDGKAEYSESDQS